jgi:hypothetical protein
MHGEKLQVAFQEDLAHEITATAPMIARRRLWAAATEAIAELAAAGLLIPADQNTVPAEERGPQPFPEITMIGYKHPSGGDSVRVLPGLPLLAEAYRLPHALRGRPAWHLDVDLFAADLSELELDPRTRRTLHEALEAFRRGLFLAAANLLGGATEGAWYAAAERLMAIEPNLRRPLEKDQTAKIEKLVHELAQSVRRTEADELLAHASLMREIRNYGVHPRTSETPRLEDHFSEDTCGMLVLATHRHLRLLAEVVEAAVGHAGGNG